MDFALMLEEVFGVADGSLMDHFFLEIITSQTEFSSICTIGTDKINTARLLHISFLE